MIESVIVFILGACWGSFLNVCIHRLPKDLSIVKPFSFCPKCKTPILWYDNIPLVSFLILRGKCRACKERIALRYPLVELITALLICALYRHFGLTPNFFKFSFFFSLLVVVSFIDIDYHAIPVYLCFIGIAVGLSWSVWETVRYMETNIPDPLALPFVKTLKNLILGFGFTYLFKFFGDCFISLYLSWRKKESIEGEKESLGLGDVDFMGMVAVFIGIKLAALVFFLAPFFAIIYSVFALIFKRSHLIPYLPYLSAAALTAFFWGDKILGLFFR
ncbi:MAG: prepilin peptidase [Candidatus Omnitrophica bacterium]|nr:prepilin peptidase [Candidatus Omnitrophota bacterium]